MMSMLAVATAVCMSPPPEFRQAVTNPPASAACGMPIDIRPFYPAAARRWGVEGLVRLNCGAQPEGRVLDCRVDWQDPLNMGFGAAALRMQELYRLDPEHGVGWRDGDRVGFMVPFRLLPPGVEGTTDWLFPARPQGQILAEVYAKAASIEGRATVACINAPAGQLTACRVEAEAPSGFGFGEAALPLVETYLKAPDQRGQDRPFIQRAFRIPIRFRLPK